MTSSSECAIPDYNSMFYTSGPYLRVLKENPGVPSSEVLQIYRKYLRSMQLIDPTPINDVIGWLARRITGRATQDAIVVVYGDRGTGKSLGCGYIGERLALRLSRLYLKPPEYFFTVDNVRSVDKFGTLEMLTPKKMREKQNQIFVLDDASIATNARNFQSQHNKNLNDILTTARIYRHCIILNTVASNLIDSVARSFADIGILMRGVIPGTTINECRVFRMSQSNHMGFGKGAKESIGKYFQITINGEQNRMRTWYINKPSEAFCTAYDSLRKKNTDKLGSEDEESEDGVTEVRIPRTIEGKRRWMVNKYYNSVMEKYLAMADNGGKPNISSISRDVGITREWVNVMLAENKRREEADARR
jgi:hypothetical protein